MSFQLPPDQLKKLYESFKGETSYGDWATSYLEDLRWVQGLSDSEFRSIEAQQKLWRLQGISSIGAGETINLHGAYSDPAVVDALAALRRTPIPNDQNERATALQGYYDQILSLVHQKHSAMRPQAKLARLLTGLFPRELTTTYTIKAARNVSELVVGNPAIDRIEGMSLARSRLRQVLGEESGLEEDVNRSMFCWWLNDNHDRLVTGQDPTPPSEAKKPPQDVAAIQEALAVWPAAKQRKGLSAYGGYLETWRAVVSAARNGATPEDIVTTLRTVYELHALSPKSCRALFNEVRNSGFLVAREGLWFPSEDGIRLVDDDPPDVLVERFLVQAWGLAQLLRSLRDGPRKQAEIYAELKSRYPNWTTDFAPSAQLKWAQALGLVEDGAEGMRALTEYGQQWERRLPAQLSDPVPGEGTGGIPATPLTEVVSAGAVIVAGLLAPRSFDTVFAKMKANRPDFIFDEVNVRSLHVAWHCNPVKRFVLLSGLSGTGKTALLLQYAKAYCDLSGVDLAKHLAAIPVSPDWRDPTGLLGYHNPLHSDPTWHKERGLSLLLEAQQHPEDPYFLVLDEMNIAHVEQYFAPFLSSMETGEPLRLHEEEDEINGVPGSIPWPSNLFIGGTLNMDETTHPVSDKVLDRAFTLEFWNVDLKAFFESRKAATAVSQLLIALSEILLPIRRHFGYRTADEILAFAGHADASPEMLDCAVFSKVLPRLRGEDTPSFRAAIASAEKLFKAAGLSLCANKLLEMNEQLGRLGIARFSS